LQYSVVLREH